MHKSKKMRKVLGWAVLIIMSLTSVQLNAQEQRFKAGLTIGLNASQIDGDVSAGYNKLGLVGGLQGVTIINEKAELLIELLYSQRGSQPEIFLNTNFFPFKIKTDFIEIPVMFTYKDWLDEEDDYYKLYFQGGFSYGRLIRTEIEDETPSSDLVKLGDFFNKDDFSFLIGASFFTGKHLAFTFRWSRSISLLYKNGSSPDAPNARSMQNHLWSFRTLYVF